MIGSTTLLIAEGSGVLLPGQGGVPVAPELHANQVVAWVSIAVAYFGAVAALGWAISKAVRQRQILPLVLFVAGLVAANIEPLGDSVGAIVYANDIPWLSYTLMGHRIPAFIFVGAAPYVAIGGYLVYTYLLNGRSLRDIFVLSAVYVGIPEVLIEMVWYFSHVSRYYGANPTLIFGMPAYSIVQNTTLLPVYGVVIYFSARYLTGRRIWLLVLFIPATTIGYIVGVSWPVYQALHSSAPAPIMWLAALMVIATSIASTYVLLQIPELRRIREQASGAAASNSAVHSLA